MFHRWWRIVSCTMELYLLELYRDTAQRELQRHARQAVFHLMAAAEDGRTNVHELTPVEQEYVAGHMVRMGAWMGVLLGIGQLEQELAELRGET